MRLGMLLAVMFSVSVAQAQPLPDAPSWYVLIGKHSEPWSLCYANIVAEKFKDGTYVEAELAESAKRDENVQCKLIPPTADEKKIQEACDKALESEKLARERFEKREQVAGAMSLSDAKANARSACRYVRLPRVAGGSASCVIARTKFERSQVLTVTKRLGPYPTAGRAADELGADGWRTGISPSSGNEIWFKRGGCEQDTYDRSR
jgi:hypothetical protein